jgi:hypothetical protein
MVCVAGRVLAGAAVAVAGGVVVVVGGGGVVVVVVGVVIIIIFDKSLHSCIHLSLHLQVFNASLQSHLYEL